MIAYIKRKAFGDKVVIENLSIEIKDGLVTAIEGASGKGKTTLIRILSGLDMDYEGSVENMPKSPIVLFQEDRLVESISVESNLAMVSSDKARIADILFSIGLGGELKNKVSSLSGGMKRRVSIARALLADYDILFLDEPFKGLDEQTKEAVASLIIKENKGRTLVLITHDKTEAELLGAVDYIRI